MQLESLKTFCDLVETESFTKSAKRNGVTQSAVSQTITKMERDFKSQLIERSKKNFRLTPEGEKVYEVSKQIVQRYQAIEYKIQEIKGVISGRIRLVTVYSIGLHDLPPYIKRFLQDHPEVNIHVEYRSEEQVYEDVLGSVVDLGMVAYPTLSSALETVSLRKEPLVLICHPEHSLAKMKTVKFKALSGQKFIGFDSDLPTGKALNEIFMERGVKVKPVRTFDNIETIKKVVEIDSGVAIVPEKTVKQEVVNGTLKALPLEGRYSSELAVIYKKGKVLSPAMKQFVELLKQPL